MGRGAVKIVRLPVLAGAPHKPHQEPPAVREAAIASVGPKGGRHIEIVCTGILIAYGIPVPVDAVGVLVFLAHCSAWDSAPSHPGISFMRPLEVKEIGYPELIGSNTLPLSMAGVENGTRLSHSALDFLPRLLGTAVPVGYFQSRL